MNSQTGNIMLTESSTYMFSRPLKASQAELDFFQSSNEKSRESIRMISNESLASLSAKQWMSNMSRHFEKESPAQMRKTLRKFKLGCLTPPKTPEMPQVSLMRSSPSTEKGYRAVSFRAEDNIFVIDQAEPIKPAKDVLYKEREGVPPGVLESWINQTLLESERTLLSQAEKHNIPLEQSCPLQKYFIDRQTLEGCGLSKEGIDKLYRCLFVYSAGFYNFVSELFEKVQHRFQFVGSVWRVFWTLLEFCYKREHQDALEVVNGENAHFIESLFKALDRKEVEFRELEDWQQVCFNKFQKEMDQVKQHKETVEKEKAKVQKDLEQNQKIFSEEFQLRIKFEQKISEFYTNYHDLKIKYERLAEEESWEKQTLTETTKKNENLRAKLNMYSKKTVDLEIKCQGLEDKLTTKEVTLRQLQIEKEATDRKLIEALKANQSVDLAKFQSDLQSLTFKLETSTALNEMYQKNFAELEKHIEAKTKQIDYLTGKNKKIEVDYEEKLREAERLDKEKIKAEDFATLLQDKLNVCTQKYEDKKKQCEQLLEDRSNLKHKLQLEQEKTETLEGELGNTENNVRFLNRVRRVHEGDIVSLEKALEEEMDRCRELEENMRISHKEKTTLVMITVEQSTSINEFRETVERLQGRLQEVKDELAQKEEIIEDFERKEKLRELQNKKQKNEEESEKRDLKAELIELRHLIETLSTEKQHRGFRIEELLKEVAKQIALREEAVLELKKAEKANEDLSRELVLEKATWEDMQAQLEKKINHLSKTLETERSDPRLKGYHPMVVEGFISELDRAFSKIKELEVNHQNNLKIINELKGRIIQARFIHQNLHTLADKLLKDKIDLQKELEENKTELDKMNTIQQVLRKERDTLHMELCDRKIHMEDGLLSTMLKIGLESKSQVEYGSLMSFKNKNLLDEARRKNNSLQDKKQQNASANFLEGSNYLRTNILKSEAIEEAPKSKRNSQEKYEIKVEEAVKPEGTIYSRSELAPPPQEFSDTSSLSSRVPSMERLPTRENNKSRFSAQGKKRAVSSSNSKTRPTSKKANQKKPPPKPQNKEMTQIEDFFNKTLDIDQILQVALNQTVDPNSQQKDNKTYLPTNYKTFDLSSFNKDHKESMRKSAQNLPNSSSSTMNQFYPRDSSTYQSQQLGDVKVVPIIRSQSRRARASSQPDNKNSGEQTSQNDIHDQNSNNNSGVFYTQMDYRRATIGTTVTQSQTEMFDEHADSHLFVETQPEKRTTTVDLPPLKKSVRRLKQIQQQSQRVEFNNLSFTQSSTKYLENKRNHSINLSDNFMQKTQPSINMNSSLYEIGHNNSLNASQIIKSKKTTPQKNLNKTTDSFYDTNKNAMLRKDPVLNLGIGQGFQIISELDSHRSSNKSLKPTKKTTIESTGKIHHQGEHEEHKITRPKKKRHTQHEIRAELSPEPEKKAQLDTDMRTLVDALLGQYNETEASDEILKPKVNVKGLVDKMKDSLAYYTKEASEENPKNSKKKQEKKMLLDT